MSLISHNCTYYFSRNCIEVSNFYLWILLKFPNLTLGLLDPRIQGLTRISILASMINQDCLDIVTC